MIDMKKVEINDWNNRKAFDAVRIDVDYPEMDSAWDLMLNHTERLALEVSEWKLKIVKKRLLEVAGVVLDEKREALCRFKQLATVQQGNAEIVLYNDGSLNGLRIVTFVTESSMDTSEPGSVSASNVMRYY